MTDAKKIAESIRENYVDKEESKLEQLCRIDRKVKLPAEITAYSFGIFSSLVLGTGMCLAMGVIGSVPPVGIAVGLAGIALCVANYFIYKAIIKSRKKKYGDRVLALSDEILHSITQDDVRA